MLDWLFIETYFKYFLIWCSYDQLFCDSFILKFDSKGCIEKTLQTCLMKIFKIKAYLKIILIKLVAAAISKSKDDVLNLIGGHHVAYC